MPRIHQIPTLREGVARESYYVSVTMRRYFFCNVGVSLISGQVALDRINCLHFCSFHLVLVLVSIEILQARGKICSKFGPEWPLLEGMWLVWCPEAYAWLMILGRTVFITPDLWFQRTSPISNRVIMAEGPSRLFTCAYVHGCIFRDTVGHRLMCRVCNKVAV